MSWKRMLITIGLCIPVVALLYFGLKHDPDPRNGVSPMPGKAAPEFQLDRMDNGGAISLTSLRGSIVVVNFWASWCIPCRDEHPVLVGVAQRYMPRGIQFLGVLDDDTKSGAQKFFDQFGPLPYPTLLPGKTHTGVAYGLTGVPESFIIDRTGIVAFKKTGPFVEGELDQLLEKMLAAK